MWLVAAFYSRLREFGTNMGLAAFRSTINLMTDRTHEELSHKDIVTKYLACDIKQNCCRIVNSCRMH